MKNIITIDNVAAVLLIALMAFAMFIDNQHSSDVISFAIGALGAQHLLKPFSLKKEE